MGTARQDDAADQQDSKGEGALSHHVLSFCPELFDQPTCIGQTAVIWAIVGSVSKVTAGRERAITPMAEDAGDDDRTGDGGRSYGMQAK
jgi:hypothetical protein